MAQLRSLINDVMGSPGIRMSDLTCWTLEDYGRVTVLNADSALFHYRYVLIVSWF